MKKTVKIFALFSCALAFAFYGCKVATEESSSGKDENQNSDDKPGSEGEKEPAVSEIIPFPLSGKKIQRTNSKGYVIRYEFPKEEKVVKQYVDGKLAADYLYSWDQKKGVLCLDKQNGYRPDGSVQYNSEENYAAYLINGNTGLESEDMIPDNEAYARARAKASYGNDQFYKISVEGNQVTFSNFYTGNMDRSLTDEFSGTFMDGEDKVTVEVTSGSYQWNG